MPIYGQNPRGCILVTYNCNNGEMEYLVVHNVPFAERAGAFFGVAGAVGPRLFNLARSASPIYGRQILDASSQNALIFGQMYFEIYQPGLATATIRGQVRCVALRCAASSCLHC